MEITLTFRPTKLNRKKYMEIMQIFRPSKLHWKKYVETTLIFRPSKSHRKSTWKWRGNSSKLGLRRIEVISTSNPRRINVYPLGSLLLSLFFFFMLLLLQRYKLQTMLCMLVDAFLKKTLRFPIFQVWYVYVWDSEISSLFLGFLRGHCVCPVHYSLIFYKLVFN